MGNLRFLYGNLLSDYEATYIYNHRSSEVPTFISSPIKYGDGSAELTIGGTYTGYYDRQYVLQVVSTSTGEGLSSAKFSWSDGSTWDESSFTMTTAVKSLSNGITIQFPSATMTFNYGDKWYFKGITPFGYEKAVDSNRRAAWKGYVNTASSGLTKQTNVYIPIDPSSHTAIALYDHSQVTGVKMEIYWTSLGGTAYSTASTACIGPAQWATYSQPITQVVRYLSDASVCTVGSFTNKQYLALRLKVAGNTAFDIGHIFVGQRYDPGINFSEGYSYSYRFNAEEINAINGNLMGNNYGYQRQFVFKYHAVPASVRDNLTTVLDRLVESSCRKFKPFFIHVDSTVDYNGIYMVYLKDFSVRHISGDRYDIDLILSELPK